jgi:hypothetical protein
MAFDPLEYLHYFKFERIKRSGTDNIQASCPDFDGRHARGDKRPSFGLGYNGLAHCFACDLHMNLEQLTAALLSRAKGRSINEYDAWLWLEDKEWVPRELTPEELSTYLETVGKKEVLKTYPESILDEFENGVHASILRRGITVEASEDWCLRYDKVHRRTIIPVRNVIGDLVGVTTRAVDADAYIKHSIGLPQPENPDEPMKYDFKKGLILFGEHRAYRHDTVIIVESPLDVIYAWSHGLQENVDILATFGGKPTQVHIEKLKPYKKVILAQDNDQTGQEGIEIFTRHLQGITTLFCYDYGEGIKDLGDMKPEDFHKLIDCSKPSMAKQLAGMKLKVD